MKPKLGKQRVAVIERNKKQTVTQTAFEDFNHLEGFAQINLKGRSVGAALLQKGKNRFCFVFGFKATGIHDTLKPDQVQPTLRGFESALKELPNGERLTVHLSSFTSDSDRQAELDRLLSRAPSSELRLLLMSEKARAQELKNSGTRKPKSLYLYATYTIEPNQKVTNDADWIEKALAKGVEVWELFKGNGDRVVQERFETMLQRAFSEGYLRWEHLLNIKMGLDIKPMSVQDIWTQVWHRFNWSPAPPVPQHIVMSERGIQEIVQNDVHAVSTLIQGEYGYSNVPQADRRWLKVKGKYVGALTFNAKPGGFNNMSGQLRYLWDVLCRPHVVDTEIFCQITSRNSTLVKTNVQRILKQSNVAAQLAEQSRSIDVAAQVKVRRSVQAQEKLYEGAVPVNIATVFLVHRNNLDQLDEACAALSDCFLLPAKVIRETEIAWRVWLQTLPISWERLLSAPFKRQLTYLTSEAPGLIPLTLTHPGDSKGFELVADDGGTPVRIDFIEEHRNIAVFGTTRSGKSVLVSGAMSQFLAEGYPIVCLDYPKPDGTSTFTDYAEFLKPRAAYFDIGRESNNLFEMPDLRHLNLDEEKLRERFEEYRSFLEGALVTMVLPTTQQDPLLEKTVRALIGRALGNFFKDPDIRKRYDEAQENGFGSVAWNDTPTLADFMQFCSLEKLGVEDEIGVVRSAHSQIQLQLEYWLGSRVGRAISRPSSFPTDAQLLVFALRNISNENEAAVLSLSAYSAALRRALESPKSIFFIDESPILFAFSTIARLIGRLCANGAKAGIRTFLSAQDPGTIVNSVAGSQIMENMNTRLVGRIQPIAVESFVKNLSYERSIIARNAGEFFFPKRSELYSNWLLDINGTYTYCRYYPSPIQIAAVANNPDEQIARTRVLAQYPSDHLLGMAKFAEQYVKAIRSGSSLNEIGASPTPTHSHSRNILYHAA
ncbi:hypothetical protein AB3R30_20845 [Leptolyngbyaceae cyanobacterium UHCC 1019]